MKFVNEGGAIEYDFEKKLGSGGTGRVYVGRFQGREVAVKKAYKDMIKSEREILESCDHENVVKFYGEEEDDEFVYLALELCTMNLSKYIRNPKNYSMLTSLQLMFGAASGLKYLHSRGILHQDIKPSNILLLQRFKTFQVKITDFGTSKILPQDRTSLTASQRGTKIYEAVEVVQGLRYRKFSDVFSLGIVFHEVLVDGEHPFGKKECNIESNIRSRCPPDLSRLFNIHYQDLISRMLSHEGSERPSADKVKQKLDEMKYKSNTYRPTSNPQIQDGFPHERDASSSFAHLMQKAVDQFGSEDTEELKSRLDKMQSLAIHSSENSRELFVEADLHHQNRYFEKAVILYALSSKVFFELSVKKDGYHISKCIREIRRAVYELTYGKSIFKSARTCVWIMSELMEDLRKFVHNFSWKKAQNEAYALKWIAQAQKYIKEFDKAEACANEGIAILNQQFDQDKMPKKLHPELQNVLMTIFHQRQQHSSE